MLRSRFQRTKNILNRSRLSSTNPNTQSNIPVIAILAISTIGTIAFGYEVTHPGFFEKTLEKLQGKTSAPLQNTPKKFPPLPSVSVNPPIVSNELEAKVSVEIPLQIEENELKTEDSLMSNLAKEEFDILDSSKDQIDQIFQEEIKELQSSAVAESEHSIESSQSSEPIIDTPLIDSTSNVVQDSDSSSDSTHVDPPPSPVPSEVVVTLPLVEAEQRAKKLASEASKQIVHESEDLAVALREDLEATVLRDLPSLDEAALRKRVLDLAQKVFEAQKWEGIRLHQALKQVEAEMQKQCQELLAQQRSELEEQMGKTLLSTNLSHTDSLAAQYEKVAQKYELQLTAALRSQAQSLSKIRDQQEQAALDELRATLDKEHHQVVEGLSESSIQLMKQQQENHVQDVLKVHENVASVASEIQLIRDIVEKAREMRTSSINLHKFTASLLSLEIALSRYQPFKREAEVVLSLPVTTNQVSVDLLKEVVSSLPSSLASEGIPTTNDLKLRFKVVRNEVRKVVLAPEGVAPIVSQAIGSALASLTWNPTGYVQGNGVEEQMARAEFFLEKGALLEALKELKGVQGYPKVLMEDWMRLAQSRLEADQATQTLRALAVTTHKSLA